MNIKSTQELRDLLLEAITKVEKGDMDTKVSAAIVGLSGQVIQSCLLDISYAKLKASLGNKEFTPLALAGPKK